jgi:cation diffusion facilitator family transporter
MLAEAIHSYADTLNQIFLLIGIKRGARKPDMLHPFGFSGELYFWSFIVAIILFSGGALFSIYEGIHKLIHPMPIKKVHYAIIILAFSIFAEGIAFYKAYKKVNKERGETKIYTYLHQSKKSGLIVVFMEDLAAILGLSMALIFIVIQQVTGILIFDGIASIIIGIILCFVALFLGNETKSLLLGESADPKLLKNIMDIFEKEPDVNLVIYIKSLQLGPNDVLISVKLEFNPKLTSVAISRLINNIEKKIRDKFPDVKQIFIEPDIYNKDDEPLKFM